MRAWRIIVPIVFGSAVAVLLVGLVATPIMAAIQELIAWYLPSSVPDWLFGLLVEVRALLLTVASGVVLAVWLTVRRTNADAGRAGTPFAVCRSHVVLSAGRRSRSVRGG